MKSVSGPSSSAKSLTVGFGLDGLCWNVVVVESTIKQWVHARVGDLWAKHMVEDELKQLL